MRSAVYVVRLERVWKLMVSLDVETDLRWSLEQRGWLVDGVEDGVFEINPRLEQGNRLILLSASMPLGWGVSLRDWFQSRSEMDRWDMRDWRRYVVDALKKELEQERKHRGMDPRYEELLLGLQTGGLLWTSQQGITAMGEEVLGQLRVESVGEDEKTNLGGGGAAGGKAWSRQAYDWITASGAVMGAVVNRADDGRWEGAVEVGARRIAAALEGRSLLEAELQQLLAERLPELLPVWRSAVQHAHLQGRVLITAGVAAATARGGRGPLARPRARYRCRRCGSEVHSRTPCGSCGSSGCAYCEACLAMGRSRSCALLLRGSARAVPPAAGGTGGAPTESLLDRWGLSPAQRDAACAALRFLAQPQGAPVAPRDRHGPEGLHGGPRPAAWSHCPCRSHSIGPAPAAGQFPCTGVDPWSCRCISRRPCSTRPPSPEPLSALGRDWRREDRNDLPAHRLHTLHRRQSARSYAAPGCGVGAGTANRQGFSGAKACSPLRRQLPTLGRGAAYPGDNASTHALLSRI